MTNISRLIFSLSLPILLLSCKSTNAAEKVNCDGYFKDGSSCIHNGANNITIQKYEDHRTYIQQPSNVINDSPNNQAVTNVRKSSAESTNIFKLDDYKPTQPQMAQDDGLGH
ncbi:MAG: hypothetical protein KME28_04365 [Pelatocladus maniniholoensis HA4357-MV3]|jgi:hypothetical protein|uniref:Lipoprotein n=1 Tax=Pelatocladus maniniholoensis HA4357-MV3 TaxID=1117104 RepID=A0A9E3H575_9NOST|nr:hypothetical protein [Pelatocladus maniniholoensis HA4357-MV3]